MKMTKILSLVLAVIMLASCFVACGPQETQKPEDTTKPSGTQPSGTQPITPENNPLAGTYDITMWVSELPGIAELTKEQINKFMVANPGIIINASIEGVTEADAASKVIADILTAPDIYCFAQDQLARLVQASALAAPNATVADMLKESNDPISVSAGSVAGQLYAYPMTSDNGYYLYYDTSIISPEEADSLEAIIAACEANGKTFRFALENAWYGPPH